MKNNSAMFKITYGLFVLTAKNGSFLNGCITNTLQQVTISPNRVSVTVDKSNYTHYMISQSGEFNVSIIDETADFSLFQHFGFSSGRWENKFHRFNFIRAENGIPYIPEHTNAYIACKVVKTIDLGTHTMFIADVIDGDVLSDKASMTYDYYHKNVKPKPSQDKTADGKVRYVCNICGYVYEGEIPDDFICPICKHGASDFRKLN